MGARARGVDQPHLLTNPASDLVFREFALGSMHDGMTPMELQTALRTQYPNVVVRARQLAGERLTVWYVYREGHWVGPTDEAPPES